MLKTIFTFIMTKIMPFLIQLLMQALKKKATTVETRTDVKQALASKVKKATLILLVFLLYGCNKTYYVPEGAALRLRQDVKNVDVWVSVNGSWEPATVTLKNGWYCASLTDEEIQASK